MNCIHVHCALCKLQKLYLTGNRNLVALFTKKSTNNHFSTFTKYEISALPNSFLYHSAMETFEILKYKSPNSIFMYSSTVIHSYINPI